MEGNMSLRLAGMVAATVTGWHGCHYDDLSWRGHRHNGVGAAAATAMVLRGGGSHGDGGGTATVMCWRSDPRGDMVLARQR